MSLRLLTHSIFMVGFGALPMASMAQEHDSGLMVFSPSSADATVITQRKEAIDRYIWQEMELAPARERLRELERNKAYQEERESKLGIPTEIIIEQREIQDQKVKARNMPLVQSECRIETISYSSTNPEAIRLPIATRSPAHLIFQDSTGQVWPLNGHTQGDKKAFSSSILEQQPHIYEVSVNEPYATATNNLLLKGNPQPIVIRLIGDEERNVCVLNVRLSIPGPMANTNPMVLADAGFGGGDDDVMFRLAVNDIPDGAEEVDLRGLNGAGNAWIINDRLYVRSQYWMESPPRAQIQDVSGIYVYRIEDSSQATAYLRTPDGESVRVTIGS